MVDCFFFAMSFVFSLCHMFPLLSYISLVLYGIKRRIRAGLVQTIYHTRLSRALECVPMYVCFCRRNLVLSLLYTWCDIYYEVCTYYMSKMILLWPYVKKMILFDKLIPSFGFLFLGSFETVNKPHPMKKSYYYLLKLRLRAGIII